MGPGQACACVFRQLKDDAVALVDVIAPPDFVLDSPIGRADGEVRPPVPWGAVCPGPLGAGQSLQGLGDHLPGVSWRRREVVTLAAVREESGCLTPRAFL